MGLFDTASRSAVRDQGDLYLEKASRFADEARASFQQGRFEEAEEKIRQLIGLQSRVVGERHPDYASGLCMLAEFLMAQEELNDAELLIQRAQEIRRKAIGEDHPDFASGLDLLVRLMLRYDDTSAAEPLALQAVEIRRNRLGQRHPDFCLSLGRLAEIYRRSEQLEQAEDAYREVIHLREELLGEDHPETADALLGLADVLMRRGVLDEAETALRRAIEIRRARFGETHPAYLETLIHLATLHQLKGEFDEAESNLRLLLDSRRQALGETHPDCAAVLTLLANLRQRRGDLRGSENYHRQALEARKQTQGERHPDYAVSLTQLGQVLQRIGDYQAAEPLLRQALAIRKDVFGSRHPDYATSLMNLATLVQKRGDAAWAKMLLREAVDVRKAIFGEEHPEYAHCLAILAELMLHQGEPLTKVETLLRQALDIRGKTLGSRHPAYASNLSSLAALMRRQGDLPGAELLLRQALEIRETTLGVHHPDYVTNLGNLAWVLQQQGDRLGAECLLTEALQLRKQTLGEDHPDVRQNAERLEALRAEIEAHEAQQASPASSRGEESPYQGIAGSETDSEGLGDFSATEDVEDSGNWTDESMLDERNQESSEALDDEFDDASSYNAHSASDSTEYDPYGEAMADIYDEVDHDTEAYENGYEGEDEAIDGIIDGGPEASPDFPVDGKVLSTFAAVPTPPLNPFDVRSIEEEDNRSSAWCVSDQLVPTTPKSPPESADEDQSNDGGETEYEQTAIADDDTMSWETPAPPNAELDAGLTPPKCEAEVCSGEILETDEVHFVARSADNLENWSPVPAVVDEADVERDPEAMTSFEPGENLSVDLESVVRPLVAAPVPDDLPRAVMASSSTPIRSTIMSETSSQLSQDVAALSDRFSDLGERLLAAARQLHAPGTPPAAELLDEVTECRREFEVLRDRSRSLAESLRIATPSVEELASLQDVTNLLDQVAESEIRLSKAEDLRQRATALVDRVLTLTHATQPDFAPLHECLEKARSLRSSFAESHWAEMPAEVDKLAEGDHAFSHLLTLIEQRDELSDEVWASLHESVGQAFGKSLAAAAARSKLVLPSGQPD